MTTKMMIRTGVTLALAVAALAIGLVAAETRPRRADMQAFMRQKLALSQLTLEGLTLERFDLVSKNAIRLRDMTHSNQWFTLKLPDYMTLTTNYQKGVDALYMAAVDKKLEEATEAYVRMARNCVECHRLLRTEQRNNDRAPSAVR